MYLVINKCVTAVKVSNFSGHYHYRFLTYSASCYLKFYGTLYPQKLALTSSASGGRYVDIVHSWTKLTEVSLDDCSCFLILFQAAVGLELWSMSNMILFDNIIVTDDEAVAETWATETFSLKRRKLDKDGVSST
jgi:hypothetical protein